MADIRNLTALDPDGSTFGQSASDKIGFYGKAPIVQPGAGTAGTDAATTQTLANAIYTALKNLGLMA